MLWAYGILLANLPRGIIGGRVRPLLPRLSDWFCLIFWLCCSCFSDWRPGLTAMASTSDIHQSLLPGARSLMWRSSLLRWYAIRLGHMGAGELDITGTAGPIT